jgi:hypothetical protein
MPMAVLLAPVAAYLLLYAPGHFLLRGLATDPLRGSRLFREVLLSACCTSWIGFVLAELSVYSLPALLGCVAVVSGGAALLGRGRRSSPYRAADLVGLAIVALTWLWLSPPLDTRILGSDSAGYLAAGVHLSRHGSLIFHDPTVPMLPRKLRVALFPSVTPILWLPPYLRLLGSLILRSFDTDEVLPAFHHLLTVWVAVFHGLAGSAAAQWAITLFGGLSVWAMVEFAAVTRGPLTAIIFFALLSLSAVQSWYSRFIMPEIPAQFFLWGGLACVSFWRGTQRRADAILAGLAFGVAGLMRIENAGFLFVALLVGLCFTEGPLRTQRLWLFGCAAAVWVHAGVHLFVFRTHYLGILRSLVPETVAVFTGAGWPRIIVLAACVAALLVWQYRRGFSARRSLAPLGALALCVSLWGEWQHGWSGLDLLAAYIGVPTLIAGGVGLAVWAAQIDRSDVAGAVGGTAVALALVQFLVAPHATPVPIWMVRRAATIVLPALCLGVAVLCDTVARRWHWSVAALLVGLAGAGQARPFAQLRWTPYYQDGLRHVQAVAAMLPPRACLFFDVPLTAWGFGPALWAERDLPAYYLSRYDPALILRMVRALDGLPVYWMGDRRSPPPQIAGLVATRIGSYDFTTLTPTLDSKTRPGASNLWHYTVVVYALQAQASGRGK